MLALIAKAFPAYTVEAIDRLQDVTLLWRAANMLGYYEKMQRAKESRWKKLDKDTAELLQQDYEAERAKW